MGRKNTRESLMKLFYQMDINNEFTIEVLNKYLENENFNSNDTEYFKDAFDKIIENLNCIDGNIEKHSSGWAINRISKVDLSLLRIAIYEILFRNDIPLQVSINEALEISKKYSSEESYKFVNGLLGSLVREKIEHEK